MRTKITFIIPMFNEEIYIKKCLESIVKEAKEYDEIIVVDNGSKDNSVRLVKKFQKVKLKKLPGKSIGAVRNYGARYATGELIGFIDADCVILSGWRAKVVKLFKKTNVDVLGAKYKIPEDAKWIEKVWFSQTPIKAMRAKYINAGNLVIKKRVFDKIEGFDETLITGEDAELGLRLNSNGFLIINDPSIETVHLGNPKTVYAFYLKQKWHGMGMLGTVRKGNIDKPFFMTIGYLSSLLLSLCFIFIGIFRLRVFLCILLAVVIIIGIPTITATYRIFQYKNYRYFLQLIFLYIIYYTARIHAFLLILRNNKNRFRLIHFKKRY